MSFSRCSETFSSKHLDIWCCWFILNELISEDLSSSLEQRGNPSFLLISRNLLYSFPGKTYITLQNQENFIPIPTMSVSAVKSSCVILNNSSHVSKETSSFLREILVATVLCCNSGNANNWEGIFVMLSFTKIKISVVQQTCILFWGDKEQVLSWLLR